MVRSRFSFALAVLTLGIAEPALAQYQPPPPVPESRQVRDLARKVRELEQIVRQGAATGRPVVVAPESFSADLEALSARFEEMEAVRRTQTSTIEALTEDVNAARRTAAEAQAQVRDLQARVQALEARPLGVPEPEPIGPEEAAASDPAAAFEAARRRLLEGDYAGAASGFEAFAERHPDDPKALEARYWLGESRYVREDYAGAAEAYIAAIKPWPKTSWGPDAAVKLAASLLELKRGPQVCQLLSEVRRRYPQASEAVKTRASRVGARAQCAA